MGGGRGEGHGHRDYHYVDRDLGAPLEQAGVSEVWKGFEGHASAGDEEEGCQMGEEAEDRVASDFDLVQVGVGSVSMGAALSAVLV